MKMTITFDPKNWREMSDCIGILHLMMEAVAHDDQHGQTIIDSLAPLLPPRVMKVLPDIVRTEGVTSMDDLCSVVSDPVLSKGKYGLGAKSRTELFAAIKRAK